MHAALAEGKKALPLCTPNPPVGCVVVRDHAIVSRGHTNPPGQDHAEAMAVRDLPADLSQYSLFVTLEPCAFAGRTPSCAQTLAQRKLQQVHVAILDPDERNNGKGIQILEQQGVQVTLGLLADQAMTDLAPYLGKS